MMMMLMMLTFKLSRLCKMTAPNLLSDKVNSKHHSHRTGKLLEWAYS